MKIFHILSLLVLGVLVADFVSAGNESNEDSDDEEGYGDNGSNENEDYSESNEDDDSEGNDDDDDEDEDSNGKSGADSNSDDDDYGGSGGDSGSDDEDESSEKSEDKESISCDCETCLKRCEKDSCIKKCAPSDNKPVCGRTACGELKTFPSDCRRRIENCKNKNDKTKQEYLFYHIGDCNGKPQDNPKCKCSDDCKFKPVCGYNKTDRTYELYWNSCCLKRYNCHFKKNIVNADLKYCIPTVKTKCKLSCAPCKKESELYCGYTKDKKDCKTFTSKCWLDYYNCVAKEKGWKQYPSAAKGACPKNCQKSTTTTTTTTPKPNTPCSNKNKCKCAKTCSTKDKKPVCACRLTSGKLDCKTFANRCEFYKFNCNNPTKAYKCAAGCKCDKCAR